MCICAHYLRLNSVDQSINSVFIDGSEEEYHY